MNAANTFSDIAVMVKRNMLHLVRMPQLIVFSTIQPVMFLLLFTYVFGGAIAGQGGEYIQFLLPGVLVQTIVFGSMMTGVGLSADLAGGMIDRFRSLPMARLAVLAGRTIADIVRNLFVVVLMTSVGYLIGFRIEHGVFNFIAAMAGALAFGFAFSWISAAIGVSVKDPETAQSAGFIWVFPLVFASSIFVPVNTMPDWLQGFAGNSPITLTVSYARALIDGTPVGDVGWRMVVWIIAILAVFIPVAVWRYRKAA